MATINPAFQSGGADIAPVQAGQNLGSATTLGAVTSPTLSTPTINTTQPSPTNTNTQTPTTTNTATNLQTIQTGIQDAQKQAQSIADQIAQKYQTGMSNAQTSGKPAPTTAGDALSGVSSLTTPIPPTPAPNPVLTQIQNDPGYQQLMKDQQEYLSSQNQKETLTQQYTDLSNKLGLPALNSELINDKAVIEGTEDDIRNEITKSGGFATESQVQALAVSRNKSLIQNYNNLLQTRDNAQNQLNTMMGLAKEDRASAEALSQEKMNFDAQMISYTQKFTQNAQESLKNMQQTEGWDGIYKAAIASGDPQAIQRINQTMGNGFDLQTMALADEQARQYQLQLQQQAQTKFNSDQAQAKATLAKTNADTANTQMNTKKTANEIANTVPPVTPTAVMPYNGNYKSPTDYVNAVLSKQGVSYDSAVSNTPKGMISAIDNSTGQTVIMTSADYTKAENKGKYTVIYNNTK